MKSTSLAIGLAGILISAYSNTYNTYQTTVIVKENGKTTFNSSQKTFVKK